MELWYKELGFYNNPFSIKPSAYSDDLFGIDTTKILDDISEGKIIYIEGEFGKGKTSILKKIINLFGGKRKVVYYSCNRADNSIHVDSLLKGGRTFFQKLFGAIPSDMVVLLDEVEELGEEDSALLLNEYQKHIKSIVLVGPNFKKAKLTNGIKEHIKENVFKLGDLKEEDAISLVRRRVGDTELLSDDIIKSIFKKSKKNPRLLLKNCEEICRYAVSQGYDKVTEEHIKKVL